MYLFMVMFQCNGLEKVKLIKFQECNVTQCFARAFHLYIYLFTLFCMFYDLNIQQFWTIVTCILNKYEESETE